MEKLTLSLFYLFGWFFKTTLAHHEGREQWNMHLHYGVFKAFFGGFFSTLVLILGVLVFYYYCMRGGQFGTVFPCPKRSIIPITIPFARGPNYIDADRPETIVLTSAKSTPSVFYSNSPSTIHHAPSRLTIGPWQAPISTAAKIGPPPGYDML